MGERIITEEIIQSFHQYLGNYDYFKEQKTKKLVPPEPTRNGRKR